MKLNTSYEERISLVMNSNVDIARVAADAILLEDEFARVREALATEKLAHEATWNLRKRNLEELEWARRVISSAEDATWAYAANTGNASEAAMSDRYAQHTGWIDSSMTADLDELEHVLSCHIENVVPLEAVLRLPPAVVALPFPSGMIRPRESQRTRYCPERERERPGTMPSPKVRDVIK